MTAAATSGSRDAGAGRCGGRVAREAPAWLSDIAIGGTLALLGGAGAGARSSAITLGSCSRGGADGGGRLGGREVAAGGGGGAPLRRLGGGGGALRPLGPGGGGGAALRRLGGGGGAALRRLGGGGGGGAALRRLGGGGGTLRPPGGGEDGRRAPGGGGGTLRPPAAPPIKLAAAEARGPAASGRTRVRSSSSSSKSIMTVAPAARAAPATRLGCATPARAASPNSIVGGWFADCYIGTVRSWCRCGSHRARPSAPLARPRVGSRSRWIALALTAACARERAPEGVELSYEQCRELTQRWNRLVSQDTGGMHEALQARQRASTESCLSRGTASAHRCVMTASRPEDLAACERLMR
ncbi:MAG: hypothetical protein IT376_16925 [Polyangiaceae bacterium]|nr:hypothetical protein [Polyangiaceae bacterium]